MKRSGKTNRAEPSDMSWAKNFPDCARLFSEVGWLHYFEKIDGHDTEVSYKFSQGLEKDTVTFNTLKIELTRELIAEATDIVDEGEYWFKKVPFVLTQRIIYFQMLLQIGVKEYIYISSNQSGENQSISRKAM